MLSDVSVAEKYTLLGHGVTLAHGSDALYTGEFWYVLPRMQMHTVSLVSDGANSATLSDVHTVSAMQLPWFELLW